MRFLRNTDLTVLKADFANFAISCCISADWKKSLSPEFPSFIQVLFDVFFRELYHYAPACWEE